MNSTPHIKTEGTSKFQIGEIKDNTIHYDFEKIKTYLNIKGHLLFGKNFRIYKEDEPLLFKLCCYFIRDHYSCSKMGIDTNKGILLTGPVGCGKTSLMKLLPHIAPKNTNYNIIPTKNIVYSFNAAGFVNVEKYNISKDICFDDLGVEPTGVHYTQECNVMGEILLLRYDQFCNIENSRKVLTHLTTNLNTEEIDSKYGNRVRSRLRAMFNLISFDKNSKDKRQ